MAIVTYVLGSSGDGNNVISWEVDYDDVTFLTTALRCVNGTDQPGQGQVWDIPETRRFPPNAPRVTPARTSEQRNIGAAGALRLNIVTHNGRQVPANLDGEFTWPV